MKPSVVILLVAEESAGLGGLARALSREGREVLEAPSVGEAEGVLSRANVDVAVIALARPGIDGPNLLHVLNERAPEVPCIMLVDASSTTTATELLRQGAFDVLASSADADLLGAAVMRASERHTLRREVERLRREAAEGSNRVALLGRSERTREITLQVDQLASRSVSVLITGASGTGKNVVASELHGRSPRGSSPFATVSCEHVAERLLESQLFGHRRGAFAGAVHDHEGAFLEAAGGTLYIDRIEEMPLSLQPRLLSVLESGRVTPLGGAHPHDADVRVVASSNRDLHAMVRSGTFREDLYDRIAGATLALPLLRERAEDILLLAEAFVAEAAERFGVAVRRFDVSAQEALTAYSWPGNVRELRAAIERSFCCGVGELILVEHLPPEVRAGARAGFIREPERRPTLAEAEAGLVAVVLEESGGNKTEAARRLGIDRKRLYRKIKRYGLLGDAAEEASAEDI